MSSQAPIWGVRTRSEKPVTPVPAVAPVPPVAESVTEAPEKPKAGHARGFSTVRISKNLAQATKIAANYMGITPQALLERIIRDAVKPICLEALKKARPYNPFEDEEENGEEEPGPF